MASLVSLPQSIHPILGAIRAVPIPPKPGEPSHAPPPEPFITISREAGSGGWSLAQQVVEALNAAAPGERLWTCWDRELIHKVACDHHISERLIESLGETRHTWFGDLLESMSFSDDPACADEAKVYRRMAQTIRALARTGRVVIVGQGGVFITRHLPGGIHVRLVAPFEHRVDFMAKQLHFTREATVAHLKEMDHNRHAFFRRYWPNETLAPETFAVTINTAIVQMPTAVEMLRVMVNQAVVAAR